MAPDDVKVKRLGGLLEHLNGVRFGARDREILLLAAPPRPTKRNFRGRETVEGMTPVVAPTRSERVSLHRAAKKLSDLGLIEYANQLRGERRVHVRLTEMGAWVVDRWREELMTGTRIRWTRW